MGDLFDLLIVGFAILAIVWAIRFSSGGDDRG